MKLPGMVHARNVRPPLAGATLQRIDESSVADVARFPPRGQPRQLCGRGLRTRGAGHPRRAATEGGMEDDRRPRRSRPPASCSTTCAARRRRSTGEPQVQGDPDRGASPERRARHRSRVRSALPGTHGHRPGPCAGRSFRRADDDLLQRHEGLRPAQRRRAVPRHAAREGARGLHGWAAGVRPHRGRRCRLRGCLPGTRDGSPGAHAVDAR